MAHLTCSELRLEAQDARRAALALADVKARDKALKRAEAIEAKAENREGCV